MSGQAIAPDVHPHDFRKGPKVVYSNCGLAVSLCFSQRRDKDSQEPWILVGRLADEAGHEQMVHESEWEYEIPELRDIFQFAGECIVKAWNDGNLVVKQ